MNNLFEDNKKNSHKINKKRAKSFSSLDNNPILNDYYTEINNVEFSNNEKNMSINTNTISREEKLIHEISVINDRIEELINNPKPVLRKFTIYKENNQINTKKNENSLENKPKIDNKNTHTSHPKENLLIINNNASKIKKMHNINSEKSKSPNRMKVFAKWLDFSVYDRNNIWQRDKEKRLEDEKIIKKNSMLEECTFKPRISNNIFLEPSPEKYGTFDINQMKQVFKDNKKTSFNSYSSHRTLKKQFNSVNKPKNS